MWHVWDFQNDGSVEATCLPVNTGCAASCGFPLMYGLLYYTTTLPAIIVGFPVLSLHSIPVGGGSASTRCLPTTNKTQNKKKEGVLLLRLDRKIHSLSPCWDDSTNTWSRDKTDSKQVVGQIIFHKPEWSFPGSLPSLQSPCYTRHGRETGQWGNNIFNVQWQSQGLHWCTVFIRLFVRTVGSRLFKVNYKWILSPTTSFYWPVWTTTNLC